MPSYVVNIESCQPEGGCFPPRALAQGKQPLKGWQLDVHLMWRQELLYETILKCLQLTWIFFFRRKQNNFRYRKYNYGTRLKKKGFITHPVVRGCRPGNNLLSPSSLYMFGLFTRLSPSTLYMFGLFTRLSHIYIIYVWVVH